MKTIYLGLNWIFGLLFLLAGIDAFFESSLGGLSFILIALLLLPPVRATVFSFTKKEIPAWGRGIFISLLVFSFGFFMVNSKKSQNQHLQAQIQTQVAQTQNTIAEKQKETSFFKKNSPRILKKIKQQIKNGQYENALSIADKYMPSDNPALTDLHQKASILLTKKKQREAARLAQQIAQAEQQQKLHNKVKTQAVATNTFPVNQQKNQSPEDNKTVTDTQHDTLSDTGSNSNKQSKQILAELKKIPASKYAKNRDLYEQLVRYNPGVNKYQKKLDYYTNKLKQQSTQQAAAEKPGDSSESCKKISDRRIQYAPTWLSRNIRCLSQKQIKRAEKNLLARVKKLSSKKTRKNRDGYKSLTILNPNNKTYSYKLKRYQRKLRLRTARN